MRPTEFEEPTPETIARHHAIAEALIAEEAAARTGTLDLGMLHLPVLPPSLAEIRELSVLAFGWTGDWWHLPHGARFDLSDLCALRRFGLKLIKLTLRACKVADLEFARGLSALRHLDCSFTQVSDLGPLSSLTALRHLDCSFTQVSDLGPLSSLTALRHLNCVVAQVSDLGPLSSLTALRHLNCVGAQFSDLGPLSSLTALQHLDCSRTQVSDLGPLTSLNALRHLDCSWTQLSDLGPLSSLTALQHLNCSHTQVSDLGPLTSLTMLQHLDCSETQVSDLDPLSSLTALQHLDFSATQVSDLGPLTSLMALQHLGCGGTEVSDLGPLTSLTVLQDLDCYGTKIRVLDPLSSLTALQHLDFSATQVSDLGPLSSLTTLQRLGCWNTPVADLGPLSELSALQDLACGSTQVTDLSPVLPTTSIESLNAQGCPLSGFRPEWIESPTLRELCLGPEVPGLPAELFDDDNCLPALRAHFADLAAGREVDRTVKLVVLGNGRIGKTQLCRHLRGLGFDPHSTSTHGVQVFTTDLGEGEERLTLNLWDFGGQELYHGTHALFLRGAAIFIILWTPDSESRAEVEEANGLKFRNHPLAYWLDYVRHAGGGGPVLLVQGFCDSAAGAARAPVPAEMLDGFPLVRELQFGAERGRGLPSIKAALAEAFEVVQDQRGAVEIGRGRAAVRRWIADQRGPDGQFPEDRRIIRRAEFDAVCAEAGGISDTGQLLNFLHNGGLLFHRPDHFGNAIVLDQQWLLNGIYALFDRESCVRMLRMTQGRFDRPLLHDLYWGAAGFSVGDQHLFLSMMDKCGLCFPLSRHSDPDHTRYVAPEMLPEEADPAALEERWPPDVEPDQRVVWTFPLLHPGMVRAVIAAVGGQAGPNALYWRQGVCLYERETRSRAIIRAIPDAPPAYGGRIEIWLRDGNVAELERMLVELVEDCRTRLGLDATCERQEKRPMQPEKAPEPVYGPDPALPSIDAYVSYAWGDDSQEGQARTARIEELMRAAAARGKHVFRDKDELRFGDRITPYMQRLGKGERIYLLLSDKYLRSAACTFELYEIWKNCGQDEAVFRGRVKLFQMSCVPNLSVLKNRAAYFKYWKNKTDEDDEVMRDIGPQAMAPTDLMRHRQAMQFRDSLMEILALIVDTLTPRDWDDFLKDGFGDL